MPARWRSAIKSLLLLGLIAKANLELLKRDLCPPEPAYCSRNDHCWPSTGSPEAVARLRFPQNVACGFPAPRSSVVVSQLSRFPHKERPHIPGSPTTPGWAGTRDDAPVHVAFRASDHVGTRDFLAFAAQWLAYALPYRRFADTLANANARLGADADRYSFTVVDFHLLLFAGFDRRTRRTRLPGPFDRLRRGQTRHPAFGTA
jgi:hypothetical protein